MSAENKVGTGDSDGLRHRKQAGKIQTVPGRSVQIDRDETPGVWDWLAEPIDPISISLFRVLFSFGMAWHIVRLLQKSTISANFEYPELNFHYPLARDHVITPRSEYVKMITIATLLSSITMMVGLFTKLSSVVFLILYVWLNALEKCRYNNHYYFYANLAFLIAATGCGRKLSLDSLIFKRNSSWKNVVPRWHLFILQFMIFVCYFFSGIAKINYDWFIRGQPMTIWQSRALVPLGFTPTTIQFVGHFLSIGGLLFDTFIGFMLLSPFKYLRILGFVFTMIFHISNHFLFQIGTFPWVMLATNILFIPPANVSYIFTKLNLIIRLLTNRHTSDTIKRSTNNNTSNDETSKTQQKPKVSMKAKIFLGLFVGYHLLMPLRHWLYTDHSSVNWTMTGHQFSWRMMLNDEDVLLRLHAKVDVDSDEESTQNIYGMRMNFRQVKRTITDLDLILQLVKYSTTMFPGSEEAPSQIKADIWKALNGRPFQRWVDRDVYLNKIDPDDWSQDWVLPMMSDDVINFEELQRIQLKNDEKEISTSFFMERPNETFSTFHHDWTGCKTINATCLRGELFYHNELKVDAEKLLPGMNVSIPLGTKYKLYTVDTPAVWMYEYDCHDGHFHVGMEMVSLPGWSST